MITILTEAELRQSIALDLDAVAAVEDAFVQLSGGHADVPPIMIIEVPKRHGEIDIKTALIRGLGSFAVKIASGFRDNLSAGLPSSSGLMIVLSARTGFPEALLLDNGYLTDVRTAAAGAIAAKHLARHDVETVGVVGSGAQARYQVRAIRLVRSVRRVLIWARRPQAADDYAREMSIELDLEVHATKDLESVVRGSDLLVTTTASREALVRAEWIRPGIHITAMGSDGPDKRELDPRILALTDRLVCDSTVQCARLGELHHAMSAGLILDHRAIAELGEIVAGRKPGRTNSADITVCDLTGVGVQDTAIALLACRRASTLKLGTRIENQ